MLYIGRPMNSLVEYVRISGSSAFAIFHLNQIAPIDQSNIFNPTNSCWHVM